MEFEKKFNEEHHSSSQKDPKDDRISRVFSCV